MRQVAETNVKMNNKILHEGEKTHFYEDSCHFPNAGVIHSHDCICIEILVSGKAINRMHNADTVMTPGSALMLSQIDFHQVIIPEKSSFIYLAFDENMIPGNINALWGVDRHPVTVHFDASDFRHILHLSRELIAESNSNNKYRDEVISSALSFIVAKILRAAPENSIVPERDTRINDMLDLLTYIRCHFKEKLTLGKLSKIANFSPNYLCSAFKKNVGVSLRYHLQTLRLNYALNLVKMTDMSISEICHESGFESVSHFSKIFKETFGNSPSYYRKD